MTTHGFKIGDPVQLSDLAYADHHSLSIQRSRPRGTVVYLSSDGVSIGVALRRKTRIDHYKYWMPAPERTTLARPMHHD